MTLYRIRRSVDGGGTTVDPSVPQRPYDKTRYMLTDLAIARVEARTPPPRRADMDEIDAFIGAVRILGMDGGISLDDTPDYVVGRHPQGSTGLNPIWRGRTWAEALDRASAGVAPSQVVTNLPPGNAVAAQTLLNTR